MTFSIILVFCVFLLSLLGTRVAILAMRNRTRPLDIGVLRGTRAMATPKNGGMTVVFSIIIGLLMVDSSYNLILGLLLLLAFLLLTDFIPVAWPVQLLVQLMSVIVALGNLPYGLFNGMIPTEIDKFVTALWWLWVMNGFKTMDGTEGLSGVLLAALGISVVFLLAMVGHFPSQLSNYGLILASSAIGFLWWGWPPAKIHLSESGSLPFGFLAGYVLLLLLQDGYGFAAAILPAYFLCDSSITVFRRLWRNKKIFVAHRDYYYQRFLNAGKSAALSLRYIAGIHMLLAFLAVFSILQPDIAIFALAMAYFSVLMLLGFFSYFAHEAP